MANSTQSGARLLKANLTPERAAYLAANGEVVPEDALEHLAKTYEAAAAVLREIQTAGDCELVPIVILDKPENALILLWQPAST